MMVRDGRKKIDAMVYSIGLEGSKVPAGLAHTHPDKPVNYPDIDTREYGVVANYVRHLKADWHKYDHTWFGGIYRTAILVFIFLVVPSLIRLHNKMGGVYLRYSDDVEQRYTDFGYETQTDFFTLAEGEQIEVPGGARDDVIKAVKLLIDTGLLANSENFEEDWAKIEPYLAEDILFSEGRPYNRLNSIVKSRDSISKFFT